MTEDELRAIEARLCPDNCDACIDAHALVAEVRRLARYEAALAGYALGSFDPDDALPFYLAAQTLFDADAGQIGDGDAPRTKGQP